MSTHLRNTILLATDQQRSVLSALNAHGPHPIAYSPYGHRPAENDLLSLLGFNGEPPDPLTGCFHLGNGYRQFNPVLMRFNSPDSWSPFGQGGVNAYAYCGGDPVNRTDPTGHFWGIGKFFRSLFGKKTNTANTANTPNIMKTMSKPESASEFLKESGYSIYQPKIHNTNGTPSSPLSSSPTPKPRQPTTPAPPQEFTQAQKATIAKLEAIAEDNRLIKLLEDMHVKEGSRHRHSHDERVSKEYRKLGREIAQAQRTREVRIEELKHSYTRSQLIKLKSENIRKHP